MKIEIIGIDHLYFSVTDLGRSEQFYDRVMRIFRYRKNTFLNDDEPHIQYFNRHFGLVLRPAHSRGGHDPFAPGLHHFCFRVEDVATVDAIAREFAQAGIECSKPEFYPEYSPDYYAIFFADPDGIRLEVTNFREQRRKRAADSFEGDLGY